MDSALSSVVTAHRGLKALSQDRPTPPEVPAGVLEVRGADSPWPVYRAADYVDAALGELPAEAVDVFDLDRQLDPVASRWRRDRVGARRLGAAPTSRRWTTVSPILNTTLLSSSWTA